MHNVCLIQSISARKATHTKLGTCSGSSQCQLHFGTKMVSIGWSCCECKIRKYAVFYHGILHKDGLYHTYSTLPSDRLSTSLKMTQRSQQSKWFPACGQLRPVAELNSYFLRCAALLVQFLQTALHCWKRAIPTDQARIIIILFRPLTLLGHVHTQIPSLRFTEAICVEYLQTWSLCWFSQAQVIPCP